MTIDTRQNEPFDPNYWPFVLSLLSMDVVMAFSDMMGLPMVSPTALRDVLRAEIVRVRWKFFETPPEQLFFSADEVLDTVALRLGPVQRDALVWWANHIFHLEPRNHLDLLDWFDVLRKCTDQPELWRRLAIPDPLRSEFRRTLGDALGQELYYQRLFQIYEQPLSDWDLHMYVTYMFDDDDDIFTRNPDGYLFGTVAAERGYAWWAWLLPQLDAPARAALWRSATEIMRDTPNLRYIGVLTEPEKMMVRFDPSR